MRKTVCQSLSRVKARLCGVYSRPLKLPRRKEKQVHEQLATSEKNPASGQDGTRVAAIAMYCVLLASYAVNAADRQLFPLLAHEVRQEYGFSLADTGLLSTIFTLGLAIAGLPTGYLLASPASDFVTGHTLFVDGGWHAAL